MKKCCIVGGGDFSPENFNKDGYGLIIAADSGCKYLDGIGVSADVYIGDFDSLGQVPEKERVIKLPVEKDDTDVASALKYALERGYREIDIFGGLGGSRFSHSVANLQLMLYAKNRSANLTLFGNGYKVLLLRNETLNIADGNVTVSIFAAGEKTRVKTEGMKYEFNGYLTDEFPLGISNSPSTAPCSVTVSEGSAFVIIE